MLFITKKGLEKLINDKVAVIAERLYSLEEVLDVDFIPKNTENGYSQHKFTRYASVPKIDTLIYRLQQFFAKEKKIDLTNLN